MSAIKTIGQDGQALPARTCKGTTKAGQPCRATAVAADGYCFAHGRTPLQLSQHARMAAARSHEVRRERAKTVRQRMLERVEEDFERMWAGLVAGLDSEDAAQRRASAEAAFNHALGRPAVRVEGDLENPVGLRVEGRAVVGLADVVKLATELGVPLGLDAGDAADGLPAGLLALEEGDES